MPPFGHPLNTPKVSAGRILHTP